MAETRVDKLTRIILDNEQPSTDELTHTIKKKVIKSAVKSIGMRIKINKCPSDDSQTNGKLLKDFYTNDENDIVFQLIKKTLSREAASDNVYKIGDQIHYKITMVGEHAISSPHVLQGVNISREGLNEDIITEYIAVLCKKFRHTNFDLIVDVAGLAYRFNQGEPSPNRVFLVGPYVSNLDEELLPLEGGPAAADLPTADLPAAESGAGGPAGGGGRVDSSASGAGGPAGGARRNYRRSRSKKKSNKKLVQRKKRRVSKKKFRR